MQFDLQALGLSVEDIQERVISGIVEQILTSKTQDEDGNLVYVTSRFKKTVEDRIMSRVDEQIERLVAPVLDGAMAKWIDDLRIERTNGYGQPKAEPETVLEYTLRSIGEYLYTGVDWQGRTAEQRRKAGDSNWNGARTETNRITFMLDKQLSDFMAKATQEALKSINEQITGGLAAAVKFELQKINAKLKG